MSQRDRGGPRERRTAIHPLRRRCARPPPLPTASPPQGGEKIPNFSPRCAGGDVAERQRGAARTQEGGTPPRRRCARPPLCLPASPPAVRGEMSRSDRGGPRGRRRAIHPPVGAARAPPSAYRHLPPKGGRKFRISPPAVRGEMSRSDRGGPRGRRPAVHPPVGAARAPPSAYRHLPPKGGRKFRISPPAVRGEMSRSDRGGARAPAGGTPPRRRCERPPSAYGISPPRGGEKEDHRHPPGRENKQRMDAVRG